MAVRNISEIYLVGHERRNRERRHELRLAHDAAAALSSIAWLTPALPYFPKRPTRRHRA